MNMETIYLGEKEYKTTHKVFLVNDGEEIKFTLDLEIGSIVNFALLFRKTDKPEPVTWKYREKDDVMSISINGWQNALGFTTVDMTKLGDINQNDKKYIIYFRPASQHVGGVNLVHIFFYLESVNG